MQILALSDVYFPQRSAVSGQLATLVREVQAKGHSVTLVVPDYPGARDAPGEDAIRVSSRALAFGSGARLMKMHRVLELSERLKSWNYDVVHIHTPFVAHAMGIALARRLGVPAVETLYPLGEEDLRRYVPRLGPAWARRAARWAARLQTHGVAALILNSVETRERLRQYGVRKPMTVIPAGIETHLFQGGDGARFRAEHGVAPERPLLLHVDAALSSSTVDFLLAVLLEIRVQIPSAVLAIASRGSMPPWLGARIAELNLREHVVYSDVHDHPAELADSYGAAQCFVCPPSGGGDARATALLEAMAAGLPVVGTERVRRGMVCEESPVLVTSGRVGDFVAAAVKVLREREWRAELAAAGREYVQRRSASVTVEQMLDCYRAALATRPQTQRVLAR